MNPTKPEDCQLTCTKVSSCEHGCMGYETKYSWGRRGLNILQDGLYPATAQFWEKGKLCTIYAKNIEELRHKMEEREYDKCE